MQKLLVITGRLTGPRSVELDEPVVGMTVEVEVLVRPAAQADRLWEISDYLRSLPSGIRSKDDIDAQILEERNSWGKHS